MRYIGSGRHMPRAGFVHVRFENSIGRELARADLPVVPDVGERISFGSGPYYVVSRHWVVDLANRHEHADLDAASMHCWIVVREPEPGDPGYSGPT